MAHSLPEPASRSGAQRPRPAPVPPPERGVFSWRDPDYAAVFRHRAEVLGKIRADKSGALLRALKTYYRDHPADFINDFGVTFDPRNIERGLPALVPFILFPKQREAIDYIVGKWRAQDNGTIKKSREVGMSWVTVSLACTLALFHEGMVIGFGSRKEEYVDASGSPKSLFWKARQFLKYLPEEFRGGWSDNPPHSVFKRISIPATGSVLAGEAGDGIGRGDRASLYIVDEAAFLERPLLVDASLSQTTNCRIDVSSANGQGNPFAQKCMNAANDVFALHWRDDPRKDDAWYADQVRKIDNPVIVAQELDINFAASATGVLIPGEWVNAAVDAHLRLGITVTGAPRGALDVADEGVDHNALAERQGILVRDVTSWSGEGSDIFATVAKAFGMCDEAGIDVLDYDADGLGAGVRGDARVINEKRTGGQIKVEPFRGSGAVFKPEDPIPSAVPVGRGDRSERRNERRNKDYFKNAKAQAWWNLRVRFMRTHRALEMHAAGQDWREAYDEDDLISLNGSMREIAKLTMELSQPTADHSTGKVVIDKAPEGTRSPNLADAVMIAFAPRRANWFDLVGT